MQPFILEQSVLEGKYEFEELFEFVKNNAPEFDAYGMEKAIFSKLMKIGFAAMKGYFAVKGTGNVGNSLELDDGTVLIQESTLRGRDYFSIFGKLKVPRTCYRIKGQPGVMPLDAQANLPDRCYSYLLQEWMNLCCIRDSFDESNVTLERLFGLEVSQSRFEVVNQESANNYDEFYENKKLPDVESEGEIQVVSFDGKGVPVIKAEAAKIKSRLGKGEKRQKKKEATVGVGYTVDRNIRTPEEVAENLIFPEKARVRRDEDKKKGINPPNIRAQNVRRIASLERSREDVIEEIVREAKRRNAENVRPWVVVMDGALCLWNAIFRELTGINWVGILDIIHVVEYLWKVGNALHGEKTPQAEKWVYDHLLAILQGRVGRVIGGLKQVVIKRDLNKSQLKAINEAISYFGNHRQWMKYDEYLKEGYPIGSGVVESACGHTVKNRMEGTGRRWSIQGAESMLLLRSVYTSKDWNEYWIAHRDLEFRRLYGNILNSYDYADDYYLNKAA